MTVEATEKKRVRAETSNAARSPKCVTDIDRYVGTRIKERRMMLGLSQQQFAYMLDVTVQQVSKYEHGRNRIAAGRLFEISRALRVLISWFFEGMESGPPNQVIVGGQDRALDLIQSFRAISDKHSREALSVLAHGLAAKGIHKRSR